MLDLVFISDTHQKHHQLQLPLGDILIHCGDYSNFGSRYEALNFLTWFEEQPFKHKIFISGNHDAFSYIDRTEFEKLIPSNIIYLNDSGCTVEGLNFWGSPITPTFLNWYWMENLGPNIKKHWDLIPNNTDVLITHGPPKNILDQAFDYKKTRSGKLKKILKNCGCPDLLEKIKEIQPKIHVYGHIHENGGQKVTFNETLFVNAANLESFNKFLRNPIKISI